MTAIVKLEDPESGREVQILSFAKLHQTCPVCGTDLYGHPAAAVRGARFAKRAMGWFHLGHLTAILMVAPPAKTKETT